MNHWDVEVVLYAWTLEEGDVRVKHAQLFLGHGKDWHRVITEVLREVKNYTDRGMLAERDPVSGEHKTIHYDPHDWWIA